MKTEQDAAKSVQGNRVEGWLRARPSRISTVLPTPATTSGTATRSVLRRATSVRASRTASPTYDHATSAGSVAPILVRRTQAGAPA